MERSTGSESLVGAGVFPMPGGQTEADMATRDRLRLHGDSFSYASRGMNSLACRTACTLLVALGVRTLGVETRSGRFEGRALLVAPMRQRRLRANDSALLLVDVEPIHPRFRSFLAATGDSDVLVLDDEAGRELQRLGQAFHSHAVEGPAYDRALRKAIHHLANRFSEPVPLDDRVIWMMRTIESRPHCGLGELAQSLGLSPGHVCRLFSASVGVPLRHYAVSAKIRAAARFLGEGHSLTDVALMAGFSDSAHFAKAWARSYGRAPSESFFSRQIERDPDALPDWARQPAVEPA